MKVLLVANPSPYHVGAHFINAATESGIDCSIIDTREAFDGPSLLQRFNWWFRGHRPVNLHSFNRRVYEVCHALRPDVLLATGISPLTAETLRALASMDIRSVNFLTDDPWNPANGSRLFFGALPLYDTVFSTRKSNLVDLRCLGCRDVHYLPFAYAPAVHFPVYLETKEEGALYDCDISFIGGADKDRVPFIRAIAETGVHLKLYGGYWNRFGGLKLFHAGFVHQEMLRKAVAGSKVSLCLVRRANRDGHAMRSYEFPAMGACMLVEDTEEHRELYGPDGACVSFFQGLDAMKEKLKHLLADAALRQRMATNARLRILQGANTYADRLRTILGDRQEANLWKE